MILATASSPDYFVQPSGGDIPYIPETSIAAPDFTNDFACTNCGADTSGGNVANGTSSDGIWSSIGGALAGFLKGFSTTAGPVNIGVGTTAPKPATYPTATPSATAGIPNWLWLVLAGLVLVLILRK